MVVNAGMAENTIDIVLRMSAEAKGINDTIGSLRTMQRTVQDFNKLSPKAQREFFSSKEIADLQAMEKQLQNVKMSTRDMSQSFEMASLGLMFAGMQLMATFGGVFRTLASGYSEAQSANSKYNEQMSELNARFEYFKFLLFDAFANSELFNSVVGWLTRILDGLIGLPEPVKRFIVVLTAVLVALGTVMFAVFSIDLAIRAWNASVLINALKTRLVPILAGVNASVIGILAALLIAGQTTNKAAQYGWNWGDAMKFVGNQIGVVVLRALNLFSYLVEWIAKSIGALGAFIVGSMVSSFKTAINRILTVAARALQAAGFSGTAASLRDARMEITPFAMAEATVDGIDEFMGYVRGGIDLKISELEEFNRIIDSQNGVNREPTTTIIEQTNYMTVPSEEIADFVVNQIRDGNSRMADEVVFDSATGRLR